MYISRERPPTMSSGQWKVHARDFASILVGQETNLQLSEISENPSSNFAGIRENSKRITSGLLRQMAAFVLYLSLSHTRRVCY